MYIHVYIIHIKHLTKSKIYTCTYTLLSAKLIIQRSFVCVHNYILHVLTLFIRYLYYNVHIMQQYQSTISLAQLFLHSLLYLWLLLLLQVDGDTNPHLQSVFIKRFPIHTAHFASGGEEVVMAANKHWYYTYDIPSGKVTRINEIKGHSKEKFSNFIVSPDDRFIAFSGKDGYIILVSNKTKQWVGEFKMNGSVTGVAFTPDSLRLFSTGSES